jgi:hypothetical protein
MEGDITNFTRFRDRPTKSSSQQRRCKRRTTNPAVAAPMTSSELKDVSATMRDAMDRSAAAAAAGSHSQAVRTKTPPPVRRAGSGGGGAGRMAARKMAIGAQRKRARAKAIDDVASKVAGSVQVHCTAHGVDVEELQEQLENECREFADSAAGGSSLFAAFTLTAYDDCLCMRSKPRQQFSLDEPLDSDASGGAGLPSPNSALDPCVFYFTCGALVMWSVPPSLEMQLVSHFDRVVTSSAREQSQDSWLIESRSLKTATDTFTYSFGTRCVPAAVPPRLPSQPPL